MSGTSLIVLRVSFTDALAGVTLLTEINRAPEAGPGFCNDAWMMRTAFCVP
jgi:hypothetical protein